MMRADRVSAHHRRTSAITALAPSDTTRLRPLRLLAALDPRRRVAAAIGWAIGAVSLVVAAVVGAWTMGEARRAIEGEIGLVYAAHAQRLVETIDANLAGRRQWVAASATLMGARIGALPQADVGQVLTDLKSALKEIEWAGVVDTQGVVIAATGDVLANRSVASRPWFTSGFLGPYVGDVHREVMLGRDPAGPRSGEPLRFVDMSAPIRDATGDVLGVLGASLGRSWIEGLRAATLDGLRKTRKGIEVLVAGRDGTVLLGSDRVPAGTLIDLSKFHGEDGWRVEDGQLTGVARSRGFADFGGLGWWVLVREPTAIAFAPAGRTAAGIFAAIAGGGVFAALIGALVAARLMRRLKSVAEAADDLRLGRAQAFSALSGQDEAARISRSLGALIATLQTANTELTSLNAELDQRVAARAREIERMEQENRFAAVVRERLRIARDLHDTLAHSLLALLTQIRLARRLVGDPARVDGELAAAEEVAREGMNQARDAVMQLRYSPVRDDGLSEALRRMVKRLRDRIDIEVTVSVDDRAASLADRTTEAVFRIVEEAVRNVEKHAEARHIAITARLIGRDDGDHLVAEVVDDGVGFDPDETRDGHFGLVGVREQADLAGATLEIESRPGEGTRVGVDVLL
jgi:signal transduction histidine kinase